MTKSQVPNKLKIANSKSKKSGIWCLVFGICLVIGAWCLVIPVRAVSPTPQTTPTSEEATSSSKEKAKQILEAVKERVKERQLTLSRRAYVGNLKSIADMTLILETKQGIRQVQVSTEAAILQVSEGGKKNLKFADLPIGEETIAMGYVDENEILEAKRIIVVEKPTPLKRKAIYGLVETVDTKEKTITVNTPKKGENWTIDVAPKTDIHKDLKLADIAIGDRLVAIGILDKEEPFRLAARKIVVLPSVPKAPTGEAITPTSHPSPTKSPSPIPTE